MGAPRGQRNRAREKSWPGHDAAEVRAEKHGGVAQSIERGVSAPEAEGSIPSVPAKLDFGWIPTTLQQKIAARAKAEGTAERWSPQRRIPTISRADKLRSKISSKTFKELLGD